MTVCCTPQWQAAHPSLWEEACSQCDRAEIVSEEVLAAIATTVQPDGVVATAKRGDQPNSSAIYWFSSSFRNCPRSR